MPDAHSIWVRWSVTSSIHLLNGVVVALKYKKHVVTVLHSTGSKITSLASGIKKTTHLHAFLPSLGYLVGAPTPTFKDNQGAVKAICTSRIHDNNRYLVTKILWLNKKYTAGIIKLVYTKKSLQLLDCTIKPLCDKCLQAMLTYLMGIHFYPLHDFKHYKSIHMVCCKLLKEYLHRGQLIPLLAPSLS
jgi:hypothetical protein